LKYGIDIGHNCPPTDTGAVGIRREDELNKEVGLKVIEKLRALRYEVVYCTPGAASSLGNSLYGRINKANVEKVDFYVSIHFNAGGGRGTEVFAMSNASKEVAKKVVNEIAALGYINRGVKDGKWLYVLKNTKMPSILVECGFVDSAEDMQRFNAEKMANAIVKGLTGSIINEKENTNAEVKPSKDAELLKIQKSLNILKILDSNGMKLIEDGIMGEKTISSIKRFQSVTGLEVNGLTDLDTMEALVNILDMPLLQLGNRNNIANRYVQWRLNIVIDGIFGNDTNKAVSKYQTSKGLKSDSIIGGNTWSKLLE
jgi:N-acetylmuramoyl-L-alanine amidase